MGFGLFNSESKSYTTTTTNNSTDSYNRTQNLATNLADSGNTTITIPSAGTASAGAATVNSLLLPMLALGTLGIAGLLILRR